MISPFWPLNALLPDHAPNREAVPLQFSNRPDIDFQNTRVVAIDVRHSFSVSHARCSRQLVDGRSTYEVGADRNRDTHVFQMQYGRTPDFVGCLAT